MGQKRGQPDLAGVLIDGGGLDSSNLVLAKALAHNIKAACERGIAESSITFAGNGERTVVVRDFSGLVSSPWALASAAAIAPMVSLDRCMVRLHVQEVEADRARFGAFGAQAVTDRPIASLASSGTSFFQVGLGAFVLLMGRPGPAERACKLRPRIRGTHIDDTDRL